MSYKVEDFKMDLRKSVSPDNHIWVSSGYSTCAPLPETVIGVKGCFSPPFAARDTVLGFELEADNHVIPDTGSKGKDDCGLLFAGAQWRPDKIIRKGTYHFKVEGKILSIYVVSELIPLTGKAGFMVKVMIHNRVKGDISIKVKPNLDAGHPVIEPLKNWGFSPPQISSNDLEQIDENVWENKEVRVTMFTDHYHADMIQEGGSKEYSFAVVYSIPGNDGIGSFNSDMWQMETQEVWKKRIALANKKIPELISDIPGLEDYYKRSLISLLVCLWENENYICNPFPATSGMDGGSICCYPWDVAGYSAESLVMLMEDKALEFIKLLLTSGIDKHISMSMDGNGVGWCSYSYSMWSITYLYWIVVKQTGKGLELFDDVVRLFLAEEARLEEWQNLKNYGKQHNLLEMRTAGNEYFTPSPNAERAWCYDRLADIADHMGREGFGGWHKKAEAIRMSICENLWDENKEWFTCVHPDGHIETVYTIQAYDVLRMGACTEPMKNGLIKQLRDGAFLGKYGVSSVSAEDEEHYELNDPDWSGGGSYTGEGPNLAETLWNQNEPQLAWDVLRRHFWMGEMLPYFPQEHYCDKPAVPANKRANIIAGTAGIQAIIFGMAGIKTKLDGSLMINPQPPKEGVVEIKGYRHKRLMIHLIMQQDFIKLSVNDKIVYEGEPKELVIY